MKRILAYRFSSFGDVLLTIPVIISFINEHKKVELIFFTRSKFAQYFPKHEQLTVIGIDLDNSYSGFFGLIRLLFFIKKNANGAKLVFDFHNVVRTQFLNALLYLSGIQTIKLKKPRKRRRKYIKGINKAALPGVLQLYSDVINRGGYKFPLLDPPFIGINGLKKGSKNKTARIGIAPFSKHKTKTWPLTSMLRLVEILQQEVSAEFYLFGSPAEISALQEHEIDNFLLPSTKTTPASEIDLIHSLDVMISMDSANMHLADIIGIPVISIWGGTHPDLGFKPNYQESNRLISSPTELECRPCSVYGKESCKLVKTPFACLNTITPEMVAKEVLKELLKEL